MNPPRPSPPSRPLPPPIRYEVDFQAPVEYTITHRIVLDPDIIELLHDFLNPPEFTQMTSQEFKDYLDGKVNELKAAVASEHDQVLAAIKAAQDHVSDNVPDSAKQVVDSAFGDLTDAVKGIHDDSATTGGTPPAPTDGGTVTPVSGSTPPAPPSTGPNPEPSTTPPTPGGEGQPVPSSVAP